MFVDFLECYCAVNCSRYPRLRAKHPVEQLSLGCRKPNPTLQVYLIVGRRDTPARSSAGPANLRAYQAPCCSAGITVRAPGPSYGRGRRTAAWRNARLGDRWRTRRPGRPISDPIGLSSAHTRTSGCVRVGPFHAAAHERARRFRPATWHCSACGKGLWCEGARYNQRESRAYHSAYHGYPCPSIGEGGAGRMSAPASPQKVSAWQRALHVERKYRQRYVRPHEGKPQVLAHLNCEGEKCQAQGGALRVRSGLGFSCLASPRTARPNVMSGSWRLPSGTGLGRTFDHYLSRRALLELLADWVGRPDSNRRAPIHSRRALPLCYDQHKWHTRMDSDHRPSG